MIEHSASKYAGPSKSALKREALGIEKLTRKILELGKRDLEALQLDAEVMDLIEATKKIKTHTAQRRQLRYLTRLIQSTDTQALEVAMTGLNTNRRADADYFQQLERYREMLIGGDVNSVDDILQIFPQGDATQLRRLQVESQMEKAQGKSIAASRLLFRYLRKISE